MYPAYDLNHAYEDTDVFVSLAKLKNHATCGVTLSLKNCFGCVAGLHLRRRCAGVDEPNENPTRGRCDVVPRGPSGSPRNRAAGAAFRRSTRAGYRVPHIVADLVAARPIHLAIIDGVESMAGGEGPWIRGVRAVQAGRADRRAESGVHRRGGDGRDGLQPARHARHAAIPQRATTRCCWPRRTAWAQPTCQRIDVRGVSIEQALYRYDDA